MMRRCLHLILLLIAAIAAVPASARDKGPLVLAAASLQESLNAAADAWAARGHPRPIMSFAASSALARQIEAGAPADLFLCADQEWMNALAARRLLRPGTRSPFLTNRLVIVAPAEHRSSIPIKRGFPLARVLGNGRLAMADPNSVPAGKYGKAALTALGVWPSVSGRIAIADNVRGALAMVERRQAPYGIVYETDARAASAVRVVGTFPAASHAPIVYPLAILARSSHADAPGFRRFLLSAQGKAIFHRYGFGVK